jgi:hypothetical protein
MLFFEGIFDAADYFQPDTTCFHMVDRMGRVANHLRPPGNRVLFFEGRFEILEVYRDPRLRPFRGCPEVLDRPSNWLP